MKNSTLYKAMYLEERKNLKMSTSYIPPIKQAYAYWRDILEMDKTEFNNTLKKYLNIEASDLDKLYELGITNEQIQSENKTWISNLNKLYYNPNYSISSDILKKLKTKMFYPILIPIINIFIDSFYKKKYDHIINHNCYLHIINQLSEEILQHLVKTLILELNIHKKKGILIGETSSQRYNDFCEKLYQKEFLRQLIDEYPVLFRLISDKIEGAKNLLQTIIFSFENDKKILQKNKLISCKFEGKINEITINMGDTHNGGYSVSIIELDNFEKIVFKPRDLEIDIKFNNLLHWLNNSSEIDIHFKTISIVNNKSYGWTEFIEYKPLISKKEIADFYNSLGGILALLYILNATDFHYENIIAYNQYPVLIDLESLFHTSIHQSQELTNSKAINQALQLLMNSVLSIGILPYRKIYINKQPFDISGINNVNNQTTPFKMDELKNNYTDNAKISKVYKKMKPANNSPINNNEDFSFKNFKEDIVKGFKEIYMIFLNNKKYIKEYVFDFENIKIRKLLRNTMDYSKLLKLSLHPDFLRNQIDREILFLRLENENSLPKSVFKKEIEQMLQGDVPVFYSYSNDRCIYTYNKRISADFFRTSGLGIVNNKIDTLSINDLENQIHLMKSVISESFSDLNEKLDVIIKSINDNNALDKIEDIANLILENSMQHEYMNEELIWIGLNMNGLDEENWKFSVSDLSLYDGNMGIAIFFAYLWKVTKKTKYKVASYKTIKPIMLLMENLFEENNLTIGVFEGISSPIYVLHHLGELFNDQYLINTCLDYTKQLERYISSDKIFDIIGGSAGALITVLNLYSSYKKKWLLKIAHKLTTHIMDNAIETKQGIHWPRIGKTSSVYIGFSHGVTGILTALSGYYLYNSQKNIYEMIRKGLKYENTLFSDKNHNWYSNHLESYPLAWCHGAPGILLGRKIISENLNQPKIIQNSFSMAFDSIIYRKEFSNLSLCHGELGLLDILYQLNDTFKIDNELYNSKKNILLKTKKVQYKNYGLLTGISGLGYGLLRMYFPKLIPSILSLEKPNLNEEN
ncbi:type 2 lanthipeptide synthetase LanM family protein [Staphylococcus hominis]|uniref:type 2 lanthipeptide synthetase LanM family protein n=1 Tax=Staphylococcus hominis TaxID=1290 RepID=UPI001F582248|nr:type 2 lanthipeptide synthetase LanM family protein [Staphylococcus hominis]MCI2877150.1 type 2 lantipeptide synthetase LanM family protein [Staphylococcus hominis]